MRATEARIITGNLDIGFWETYTNEAGRVCQRRLQLYELPNPMLEVWFGDRLPWLWFLRWRVERERG